MMENNLKKRMLKNQQGVPFRLKHNKLFIDCEVSDYSNLNEAAAALQSSSELPDLM